MASAREVNLVQDPITLYKLIVLYMLDRVSFPLTGAQISDFMLEKEYTNFLTLQQIINELTEAGMISAQSIRNRTHLSITNEGKETLRFFENRIGDAVKKDVLQYFAEKEFDLRPASIIRDLDLKRPIYAQTASYGHFGRDDLDLPWEKLDKVEALRKYVK